MKNVVLSMMAVCLLGLCSTVVADDFVTQKEFSPLQAPDKRPAQVQAPSKFAIQSPVQSPVQKGSAVQKAFLFNRRADTAAERVQLRREIRRERRRDLFD